MKHGAAFGAVLSLGVVALTPRAVSTATAATAPTAATAATTANAAKVEHFEIPGREGLPFAESVRVGDLLFLSGQIGVDWSRDGALGPVAGGIVEETKQIFVNIAAALGRRGADLDDLVKCTVMLADIAEWPAFNEVYRSYFSKQVPARSAMGVNGLALGARVEVECVAALPETGRKAQASGYTGAPDAGGKLLGKISFPNSGAAEANSDFLEGVLYLHNFEYEDAAVAFGRAQEKDPDFAMAFWGEAMTHNHPLWSEQNTKLAVAALERLAGTPKDRAVRAGTERERRYLEAVELLYGTAPAAAGLEKRERNLLYRDAMKGLAEDYAEDQEARAFYALSILGTSDEGRDFATYMRAAAVAQTVWSENREHPGAAHYLIHSYDDPVHAPLGLPMARVYSRIAPAAAHAQHMTSHIFVALGMWDEVIEANLKARDVQNARMARLERKPAVCAHYPYWLFYGYLQGGRIAEATEVMEACKARVTDEPTEGELWHFHAMRSRLVIDSEDWDAAEKWGEPMDDLGTGAGESAFTDAYVAWKRDDAKALLRAAGRVEAHEPSGRYARNNDYWQVAKLEVRALQALHRDDRARAIELLREAAELEDSLPFAFGPPPLPKPAWELLGEVLVQTEGEGGPEQDWVGSRAAFARQLERTPARTSSLRGLARAAQALGRTAEADATFGQLARIWRAADAKLPARMPVAEDLKQSGGD